MTSSLTTAPLAQEITLSFGAKLIYKHLPGAPRLALNLYLPGGNGLDGLLLPHSKATAGAMDVLDRLLTKGTATRSAEQIAIEIDGLSLELDVETRRDSSLMSTTLLDEDLTASLSIMGDLLFNSTLAERERECERLAGEVAMELDSPKAVASDKLVRAVFGGTPYGTVSSVLLENLETLNQAEPLAALYQTVYQPGRLVIVAVGNTPLDTLKTKLEQAFGPYVKTVSSPSVFQELFNQNAEQLAGLSFKSPQTIATARDEAKQCHIYKAWLAPQGTHPDATALTVMNTLLGGGGLSSRLFIELRDKQGLAYNVRSSLDGYKHRGQFVIYIGTEPSNTQKCLKGFEIECQKLMDTPVSAQELAETKANLLGRRTVFLETPGQWANYLGSSAMLGRSLDEMAQLPQWIEAVTAADIQRVAQGYLGQPAVVSMAGPSKFF